MRRKGQILCSRGLLSAALGLVTMALFLPSLWHEFVDYDDQQYVTENRHVQGGLNRRDIAWAFGYHVSNWHPVTWLSHELDCQLYGLKPAGHHATNVLLHAANSVLLFLALFRLTGARWRSLCVAALFAWHPLHVESVAWVSERKDLLCAFFWMLTLLAYSGYVECRHPSAKQPARGHSVLFYFASLLAFGLALMSKSMAVTLPFVLLLLDFWPLKRGSSAATWSKLVLEKAPFIALAVIACVMTVQAQRESYAVVSVAGLPVGRRMAHALIGWAHYLIAAVFPAHLAVYYPYPAHESAAQVAASGLLLACVSALIFVLRKKSPYLATGWLWYLGTLVPVIGLVQVGDQAWADRYSYLPLIGLFVLVVWGVRDIVEGMARSRPGMADAEVSRRNLLDDPTVSTVAVGGYGITSTWPLVLAATAVAAVLLTLSSMQLRYWKNTQELFEHAARVTPNNYKAITLLGSLLARDGKLDEARQRYAEALRLNPRFAEAHFFLGNALDREGKLEEAVEEYRQAVWFKPIQEQTRILMGIALAKQKKYDEASEQYRAALKLNPESAVAHNNLAKLLHTQGQFDQAADHYKAALELDPNLAQAHNNLGIVLLQRGKPAEGAAQLREALRLDPGNRESQCNLALALNQLEAWSEAADLFARTASPPSADPNADCQFAIALAHLGRTREAMSRFASALLARPDTVEALDGLAWILATSPAQEFRNGTEAVRMAERACELTSRSDALKLRTLAAAYAENGRFSEATTTAEDALKLASGASRTALADQCRRMLENFRASRPWRTSPSEPVTR